MAIAKLAKPTDVSEDNLTQTIQSVYDKLNELIVAINTESKAVPKSSEGSGSKIKIIDDQNDGVVKLGLKSGNTWYTIDATEG